MKKKTSSVTKKTVIRERIESTKKDESFNFRSVLDNVSTNLMICNTERVITYCNVAVISMLTKHVRLLREAFGSDFDPKNLVGQCIDQFHVDPDKQAKILGDPKNLPYQSEIEVKGLLFGLKASALKDEKGVFVGIAVEWRDSVAQARKAASLESMVEGVETKLMICNKKREITYCNPAVIKLLTENIKLFKDAFGSNFDPNKLVGQCIDQFHNNPDKQAKILGDPRNLPYKAEISLGGALFGLSAISLLNENGEFMGVAVEWTDTVAQARKAASLDSMVTNVETQLMICDLNRVITYCNPAVIQLLKKYEKIMVQYVGLFDANNLVGTCIDKFHKNPAIQSKLLSDPKNLPYKTEISVGDLVFGLNAMALSDEKGKFMGIAVEWIDSTAKSMYKKEVQVLIAACQDGDLKVRGKIDKLDDFYGPILSGTNDIIDAIVAPIEEIKSCLSEISKGDMSAYVVGEYKGDHELLKNSLNDTLDSLNNILGNVKECASQISAGAAEVSNSSQAISQAATEQAASLEEISSSMNEMASQTKNNAENAAQASRLASATQESAMSGNGLMENMMGAMSEIEESSKSISKIIKVIDEIAFQTNLLALNAAVEAARAGAHGKGFAVVAEEVRNLAARSANAAKETTELIEGSSKKVSAGTGLAQKTSESLKEIVSQVAKVTDLVSEIAASSNEQAQGISQVNSGLEQLDIVTQQNTASSEESASASVELKQQGGTLLELLGKFKLKEVVSELPQNIPPEMMKIIEQFLKQNGSNKSLALSSQNKPTVANKSRVPPADRRQPDSKKKLGINPDDIIPMGDFDDLGKY